MRKDILETGLSRKKAGISNGVCQDKNKRPVLGFTLVELIVVITILAILGTIAIMAFSGYSKNARDSARISDITNMKKSLELWILQSGTYPEPTTPTNITYSGATVWTQGTYGDTVHQTVGKLDKKPLDPIYDSEYTYSVTNSKKEYQLGAVLEKDTAYESVILQANAVGISSEAYVTGNYNGVVTSTQTGGLYYMLAVPSIILSDINDSSLLGTKQFVLNKKHNLPHSYANKSLTMTGSEVDFTPSVVWSGTGYTNLNDQATFQTLVTNLQTAYSTPPFQTLPEYMSIATTSNLAPESMSAVKSIIETNTNQTLNKVSVTELVSNSCSTTLPACNEVGCQLIHDATSQNQEWELGAPNCGFTCINDYTGLNCEIAPNPYASCTAQNNPIPFSAATTYPGCNTADFIVCSGTGTGYTISACNVGAITASTNWAVSRGQYFQWGRNKGFVYGDTSQQSTTIDGSIGLNAGTDIIGFVWSGSLLSPYSWANTDITNNWGHNGGLGTSEQRQGPCSSGYHVPSQTEWSGIVSAGQWGSNGANMRIALKLPYTGIRQWNNGTFVNGDSTGHYWSSSPNGINAYNLYFASSSINFSDLNSRARGLSVRCFKN